ncbi:MAG TPA: hypothetical protein VES42_02855 [Pilimelia sp.]|nr:hypothetical protein [Pilimelia sp.]
MIPALWSAVVLTLVVAVAALALSLLLSRRYRELHRAVQAVQARPGDAAVGMGMPAAGSPVGDFHATTTDGDRVGTADLGGADVVVAALMVGCEPCTAAVPDLVAGLGGADPAAARPLVLVVGDGEEATAYVARLAPVARVVVEDHGGTVARALGVSTFPAVLRVEGGVIRRVGNSLDAVGVTVPV